MRKGVKSKVNAIRIVPGEDRFSDDVCLTGITGSLGCFLLQEILASTSGNIYCHVQTKAEQDVVKQLLAKNGGFEDNLFDYQNRVYVVVAVSRAR
ncbi:MAG: SDR family oxidoreductase [Gammaproteobacteria bacterium]|nr:SDR family oxidoreductase [Gammaproteobacteria bacterium]